MAKSCGVRGGTRCSGVRVIRWEDDFWEWRLNHECRMPKMVNIFRTAEAQMGTIQNSQARHLSALASVDRQIWLSSDGIMEVVRHRAAYRAAESAFRRKSRPQ
jgi:hypothetical protein